VPLSDESTDPETITRSGLRTWSFQRVKLVTLQCNFYLSRRWAQVREASQTLPTITPWWRSVAERSCIACSAAGQQHVMLNVSPALNRVTYPLCNGFGPTCCNDLDLVGKAWSVYTRRQCACARNNRAGLPAQSIVVPVCLRSVQQHGSVSAGLQARCQLLPDARVDYYR